MNNIEGNLYEQSHQPLFYHSPISTTTSTGTPSKKQISSRCGQDELHIRVEAVTPDYLSKSPLFSKQIFSRTLFPVSDFSAQDNDKTNDESRQ